MWYLSFCGWLCSTWWFPAEDILLQMARFHSPLWLRSIPPGCITVSLYIPLMTAILYSFLCWFHIFTTANCAAINTGLQIILSNTDLLSVQIKTIEYSKVQKYGLVHFFSVWEKLYYFEPLFKDLIFLVCYLFKRGRHIFLICQPVPDTHGSWRSDQVKARNQKFSLCLVLLPPGVCTSTGSWDQEQSQVLEPGRLMWDVDVLAGILTATPKACPAIDCCVFK